jgi:hypothetical protein
MAVWLAWLVVFGEAITAVVLWWEYRTGRRRFLPIGVLLGCATVVALSLAILLSR